ALLVWSLLILDAWLVRSLSTDRWRARSSVLARILRFAPIGAAALGIVAAAVLPGGGYLAVPLSVTIGVLAHLYGRRIETSAGAGRERARLQTGVIILILLMLLFWDVERIARLYGEGFAELAVSRPEQY